MDGNTRHKTKFAKTSLKTQANIKNRTFDGFPELVKGKAITGFGIEMHTKEIDVARDSDDGGAVVFDDRLELDRLEGFKPVVASSKAIESSGGQARLATRPCGRHECVFCAQSRVGGCEHNEVARGKRGKRPKLALGDARSLFLPGFFKKTTCFALGKSTLDAGSRGRQNNKCTT